MELYLLSFANHIAERVAASGEQVAISSRIDRTELFLDGKECTCNASRMFNLKFFTELAGRGRLAEDEYQAVFKRVGLADNAYHRRVGGFSKGMRQRLGIAIAVLKNAELILLDEPTSGLDPKGGFEFLEIINGLKAEGRAILMSTHDIFRVKSMADRVGIMRSGRLLEVLDRQTIESSNLEALYLEYMEAEVAGATSAKVQ